jgi:hypothetical protein
LITTRGATRRRSRSATTYWRHRLRLVEEVCKRLRLVNVELQPIFRRRPPLLGKQAHVVAARLGLLQEHAVGLFLLLGWRAQYSHAAARPELGELLDLRARLFIHARDVILEAKRLLLLQVGAAVVGLLLADSHVLGALLGVPRILPLLPLALLVHLDQRNQSPADVGENYSSHHRPPLGLEKAAQLEDAFRL